MKDIDKVAVRFFLSAVKREINKGNWYLVPRNNIVYDGKTVNYKQALLDLGIVNKKQIATYISNLDINDCFDISHDYNLGKDYNDDMYEFITYVNNIKTYVKLTINNYGVLCISFHKSNR